MKLKLSLMEEILMKLTSAELDFLIFSVWHQNNNGVVEGLTYRKVCNGIGINKSKFYSIINSLSDNNTITILWEEKKHGFWTFIINDNSFLNFSDLKEGYINLNTIFLHNEDFLNATKAEKLICLKILSLFRRERNFIYLKLTTLMNWTGTTLQSVKRYVKTIAKIFKNVTVKNGLMTLNFTDFCLAVRRMHDEADFLNEHTVEYMVDSNKVNATEEEIKDTVKLFKIFGQGDHRNIVLTAIAQCIKNKKALIPKYINSLIQILKGKK